MREEDVGGLVWRRWAKGMWSPKSAWLLGSRRTSFMIRFSLAVLQKQLVSNRPLSLSSIWNALPIDREDRRENAPPMTDFPVFSSLFPRISFRGRATQGFAYSFFNLFPPPTNMNMLCSHPHGQNQRFRAFFRLPLLWFPRCRLYSLSSWRRASASVYPYP